MTNRGFTYSTVAVPPESVREPLQRVWRDNLPLKTPAKEKYEHLYRDAPVASSHVFILQARSVEAPEQQVVGTIGICGRRFWMGGREVRAAVCADFAVDAPHRLLLPALQLSRMAREHLKDRFELGYGYPNRNAVGVMARAGFAPLAMTSRYVYVLRPGAYLGRIPDLVPKVAPHLTRLLAPRAITRALGPIADLSRLAQNLVGVAPALWRYQLTWSPGADERVDTLWQAARHEYPIVGVRTSALLSWRYPGARFAWLNRRGGNDLAYAMIEIDPSTMAAHVRDLFGHQDAFEPLLSLLLLSLWRQGVASVSVSLLGSPRLRRVLARCGFVTRGERGTVVLQVGERAPQGVDPSDPDLWHLLDVDEDA